MSSKKNPPPPPKPPEPRLVRGYDKKMPKGSPKVIKPGKPTKIKK